MLQHFHPLCAVFIVAGLFLSSDLYLFLFTHIQLDADNQSLCQFMVANFSTYMKQNSEYLSPPFYTHPRGYKLCLSVFANGRNTGKSIHVSIYVTLMRGEYDDQLKWLFEGDVVELRNWKEDKGRHKDTFSSAKLDGYYRVNGRSMDERKLGRDQFISHFSLLYNSTTTHSTFRMTVCA